jgi:malonate-semialdehyde dehydrogenase (acetylating)/methylmalonate-semialdehyde dehydrogenase
VLNVVHGDKEAVDAIIEHPEIKAISFVGSSDIAHYIYSHGTANNKRVQAMGGAKNHGIVHARRRHGPGREGSRRRGLRLGRRTLHGIAVVVPVGKKARR